MYRARSASKAAAARAQWRSISESESRTAADRVLKKAGVWDEEPGFTGHDAVLVASGYELFTPDALHGLGRIMLDKLALFMICLAKKRGSLTIFSNRIKAQDRFRPMGQDPLHHFLAVSPHNPRIYGMLFE